MHKYKSQIIAAVLILFPVISSAQLTGVRSLIDAVGGLINPLIAILVGLAVLAFFWGLAKFIFRVGGDEKAVEEGKTLMMWGLIAIFVMVSIWGIIEFISNQFFPGGIGGQFGPILR